MSSRSSSTAPPTEREEQATVDERGNRSGASRPGTSRLADSTTRLGRYIVREPLGFGGMGVVHEAFDPELNRQVALKRLSFEVNDHAGRERMMREAQALAQLSHPNVIAVHDVGRIGDEVFIAMELVEGTTLEKWAEAPGRKVDEILGALAQAGEGLMAAHAAGLVHRDFKPDNVLVGKDGRARVIDFGLARLANAGGGERSEPFERSDISSRDSFSSEDRLHGTVTAVGAAVGTPAFMPPEQYGGPATDARSDVFSFCVSLYWLLYDKWPFRGKGSDRRAAKESGRVEVPPSRPRISRRLRSLMIRGLSASPADRPPLAAIVAELRRDPKRVQRVAALASVFVVLAGLATFGLLRRDGVAPCSNSSQRLVGVWDDATRARLRDALVKSGRPYAVDTFRRVDAIVTGYTRDWVAEHQATCRATRVDGTQSAEALDLRMRCYDQRLGGVRALVDALVVPAGANDGNAVDNAVVAAQRLLALADCRDVEALRRIIPLPADPVARQKVIELDNRVRGVAALVDAGRLEAAEAQAKPLLADARALGYLPLEIDSAVMLANVRKDGGEPAEAKALLEEIIEKGSRAGDDVAVANAWISLMAVLGLDLADPAEALKLQRSAEAAVLRGGNTIYLQATFEHVLALVTRRLKRYDEALAHNQKFLALAEQEPGNKQSVGIALNNLGSNFLDLGQPDKALDHYQRAETYWTELLGADHPDVGTALTNIGLILSDRGDLDGAQRLYERALRIKEAAYGPEHPSLAATLAGLGVIANQRGQIELALGYQTRALHISEKELGARHPHLAIARFNVAELYLYVNRAKEARGYLDAARDVFVEQGGPNDAYVLYADVSLAKCDIADGQPTAAIARVQPALKAFSAADADPSDLAAVKFVLARADRALGKPDGGRRLAEAARDLFKKAGTASVEDLADVEKFLADPKRR